MGGNTALQSGRRLQWVKGIILMTPYDPSYYLLHGQGERFRGLIEEVFFKVTDWKPSTRMRMHIKKRIALQMPLKM